MRRLGGSEGGWEKEKNLLCLNVVKTSYRLRDRLPWATGFLGGSRGIGGKRAQGRVAVPAPEKWLSRE